jgi:Putative ATPase subunit of terminase (gpP-like)
LKKTKAGPTKPPVNREAVRVLAIELGAREAARRLGLNPNTVLSWAKRDNWKLPNRKGGATKASASAITLQSKPGDVLIASHKELEDGTKTALMQTLHKAAQAVARKAPLDITNMAQFRDACLSAARTFGWDGSARPSGPTIYADKALIVCDEVRRAQLIEQRQRLLEQEAEVETAVIAALPKPETQSNANVDTVNGTVAQDPSPVVQKDPLILKMESIARAESWKSEENHAGSFGPYPEEYEVW